MPGYELIGNEELAELTDIFNSAGGVLFRQGFDQLRHGVFKVRTFEQEFAKFMGTKHALALSSGTAAVKVALKALDIKPGDEVITQAFTFVATAEAIIEAGAIPVITDIDKTLNMCPKSLEQKITPRTKAVIVVHMLGVPTDMAAVLKVTQHAKIPVIEDTAWGCGGKFQGKYLGTVGDIGTYSFDYAKAITTGEGGMVITNNDKLDYRGRAYHDHGHENNPTVPRWEDTRHGSGFNYRMSELQGAVGLAQLKKLPTIVERQREIKKHLNEVLKEFSAIEWRKIPDGSEETAEALVFFAPTAAAARRCREELLKEGIGTKILPEAVTWHFAKTWTHMPSLVSREGGNLADKFLSSEQILCRAVALPINLKMDSAVLVKLRDALKRVF